MLGVGYLYCLSVLVAMAVAQAVFFGFVALRGVFCGSRAVGVEVHHMLLTLLLLFLALVLEFGYKHVLESPRPLTLKEFQNLTIIPGVSKERAF